MENWEITLSAAHPESQWCWEEAVPRKRCRPILERAVVIPVLIERHWR